MADQLRAARLRLVDSLNKATINGLVDVLLDQHVFNNDEKDIITESLPVTKDKARELIDMVVRKGDNASTIFIKALATLDPAVYKALSSN